MRKYLFDIEDEDGSYLFAVPAKNEAAARKHMSEEFGVKENAVRSVKDVTADYLICTDDIEQALDAAGFDRITVGFITRALFICGLAEQEA